MLNTEQDIVKKYIDSPQKLKKLYKRVLFVVSLSQIFGGAGLAAGITVGALLAQQMLGTEAYAGVPMALFTLGSAGAAFIVGKLSQRYGRRIGLSTGFVVGGLGAIGVLIAAIMNSVILLFASLFIYGAGTSTNLQARYAGTDLANSRQRATAISMTTFGAVAGSNLVEVMGKFAVSMGVPALAGPFILSAAAFIAAGLVLFILLRPDPLLIAQRIAAYKAEHERGYKPDSVDQKIDEKGLTVGATVMILTQIVMVALMTMTPVHMQHHGYGLAEVGIVIGFHIGAMYLPSPITGVLVDKLGRTAMSIASGITLLLAGLLAAFAPSDSMILLIIALSLLGLGWNFGLISGTAQIVDSTEPSTRAKIQGTLDVFIALAGATGGALSGMVAANTSYATLSLSGGVLSLFLIPVIVWSFKSKT
ncbi:MFS transporter [Bacillus altitudinis]|uniref:MFS transporter n=1 Tax=Bacillus pumilus TaxID=1408 RepID=UPI0025A17048|nr:MFS transporter [Bacillus pumilus]MDM5321978.1 MFS transporter [Bacillus pumilus]MDR4994573.1 MFS transporter [Bacillus altitudinis]